VLQYCKMPELPEVETIRMGMEKYIVGHEVVGVDVRLPKIVKEGDTEKLTGGKIIGARRFGKVLSLDLDNNFSLVAHIKLTGQFIYLGPNRPKESILSSELTGPLPGKHTHLILNLDKGGNLYYNDIRQFSWIRILPTESVVDFPFIHELGPEPIRLANTRSGQAFLTLDVFRGIVSGTLQKIKVLLMDQKKIGGVGNIYANDALFLSGIDPTRKANSLSLREQSKLYESIIEVLKQGLKYGGATEMNFVNVLGQGGGYQEHFLVYGREGKPCPNNCGGIILKIRLGGRGTYYCPNCQK